MNSFCLKSANIKLKYQTPNLIFISLSLIFLLAVVVSRAFVTEDAFINFISIRNFNDGFYLSSIPNLRTQSATSNLWELILLAGSQFTNDLPNLSVFLSLFFTILAVIFPIYYFLLRGHWLIAGLIPIILSASTSFTDYSTSGLENPLTHFLFAIFFIFCLMKRENGIDFTILCVISGLVILDRYDLSLIVMPPLILFFLERRCYLKDMVKLLISFFPILLWFVFSWFYYGSIFPDTYYAKLKSGVPWGDRVNLAVMHHLRLLDYDPVGSYFMIICFLLLIYLLIKLIKFSRLRDHYNTKKYINFFVLGFGVLAYNVYFFWIGGDYMVGRFMSTPIFLAIIYICFLITELKKKLLIYSLLTIFCFSLFIKFSELNYFVPMHSANSPDGIVRALNFDIRRFKENWYFISQDHRAKDWRDLGILRGLIADDIPFPSVVTHEVAGIIPYYAGPRSRLVDVYGLTDPLLSRMPCSVQSAAAHCMRKVPIGYVNYIRTGDYSEMNPVLAKYVNVLYKIKSSSLFSLTRIKLLISFSLGDYDSYLDSYISSNSSLFYKSGDSLVLFHYAYQETILKNLFPVLDSKFIHIW